MIQFMARYRERVTNNNSWNIVTLWPFGNLTACLALVVIATVATPGLGMMAVMVDDGAMYFWAVGLPSSWWLLGPTVTAVRTTPLRSWVNQCNAAAAAAWQVVMIMAG